MKRITRYLKLSWPAICSLALTALPAVAASGAGWALAFDGVDDAVAIPHCDALNALPLTISAWIRTTQTNASIPLLTKATAASTNGSYRILLLNGEASATLSSDLYNSTGARAPGCFLADGRWHQIAFVADTNGSRLFLDGNLQATAHWYSTPGAPMTTEDLLLGTPPSRSRFFAGWLDEVAIWKVARSDAQIKADLYEPLAGNEAGLIACWRMDEGGGETILDATTNRLNGTVTNRLAWLRSCIPAAGGALALDGGNAGMRIPAFGRVMPTNEITIEFWLKPEAAQEQVLFALWPDSATNRARASIPSSNGLVTWEFGDSLAGGRLVYEPPDSMVGVWQHFALVSSTEENAMHIYRNGQLEASKNGAGTFAVGNADLVIGGIPSAFTAGQLDEFRVWNYARRPAEIRFNMHRHLHGAEPGLVLYLPFDERAGDAVANAAQGGHMGLLSNQTSWAASPVPFAPDVVTSPATDVGLNLATLNSVINPNGLPCRAAFEWGVTTNYGNAVAVEPGLGPNPIPFSVVLTGLTPGVLHHYRIAATNNGGFSLGVDQTFLPALQPVVDTQEPSDVRGVFDTTIATLHGTAIPNWSPTWAWFEWGQNVPCGNATPAQYVGNGTNVAAIRAELSGLAAGLKHQYWLVASNSAGMTYSTPRAFSSPGISLVGPRLMTVERHAPFTDPGAKITQPMTALAMGGCHSLALTYDGQVFAWGGGLVSPSSLRDVVAISAGPMYSLALKRNGTVIKWGDEAHPYCPGPTPPGLSNVVAISAGDSFALALKNDGEMFGWGCSYVGNVDLAPDLSGLIAVSAGSQSGMGLTREGYVLAWGYSIPWQVAGLSNVVAVAAGHGQKLALRHDGAVIDLSGGQVPAGLSNIIAIAAGPQTSHSLALRQDGTVVCWDGYIEPAPAGLTNAIAVAVGGHSALALLSGGTIIGWGDNSCGQLSPPPDLAQCARPVQVSGFVDTDVPGTYVLHYEAWEVRGVTATATRTVNVVERASVSLSAHITVDKLMLEFPAVANTAYAIETSTNLLDWIPLTVGVMGTNGVVRFEDAFPTHFSARFYRVAPPR